MKMKENKFERKVFDLEKELKKPNELKKILHEIYFSNLEENLFLLLSNQQDFLCDLTEKINFCLKIQFSLKFFETEKSNKINEEVKLEFKETIFQPLENFIDELINKKTQKSNLNFTFVKNFKIF